MKTNLMLITLLATTLTAFAGICEPNGYLIPAAALSNFSE